MTATTARCRQRGITYLHGPCLARNPELADLLLSRVVGEPPPPLELPEVEQLRRERLAARGGSRSGRRRCRGDGRRRAFTAYVAGRQRRAAGAWAGAASVAGTGPVPAAASSGTRSRAAAAGAAAPPMGTGRWPAAARSARCSRAAAGRRTAPGAAPARRPPGLAPARPSGRHWRRARDPAGSRVDLTTAEPILQGSGSPGRCGAHRRRRRGEPPIGYPSPSPTGRGRATARPDRPWIRSAWGRRCPPGWANGRVTPLVGGRLTGDAQRHPRPARAARAIRFRRLIASTLLPSRAMRRSLPPDDPARPSDGARIGTAQRQLCRRTPGHRPSADLMRCGDGQPENVAQDPHPGRWRCPCPRCSGRWR